MYVDIKIILSFDGGQWFVDLDDCRVGACELRDLENRIAEILRQKPCYANRKSVLVGVSFDYDSIPAWLRQYQSHYFNYLLTVPVSPAESWSIS